MPQEPIAVAPEAIETKRAVARSAILAAGLQDRTRAAAPGPYGMTRTALDMLERLEAGLAAGIATQEALLSRVARDRAVGFAAGEPTASERRFAATFGILVACEELLGATDALSDAVLPDRAFPTDDVLPVLSSEALAGSLCGDLDGYILHYHEHSDPVRRLGDETRLAACVRSHVKRMALAARAVCGAAEHQTLLEALATATLRLPSVTYAGLERRAASDDEEPDLLDVAPDGIVGNAEVLAAGLELARTVAAFDLAAGKNPRTLDNPVLFVLGSPGCGKTVTAHAIGRSFLALCVEAGLPARFRVIRRTDWASHYQNKSASDLLRIFRDEVFGFHGVCGCYWPDIDTAFAARSDPDIRSEEKANLATLFGILDGTVGPRNGKWFLLCDANTTQMDDAMVSRLTQDPKIARGPETPADYVRLLRDLKLGTFRSLLPPDPEWERIGKTLCDAALSGRAVAAIAGRIAAQLQRVEEPPGFFKMSYDQKVQALRERAKPVDADRILGHIDHYVRFERDAADRAQQERFGRRVEEIRRELSAQAAVIAQARSGR